MGALVTASSCGIAQIDAERVQSPSPPNCRQVERNVIGEEGQEHLLVVAAERDKRNREVTVRQTSSTFDEWGPRST